MANFAVAASPSTIEKANQIMEMYAQGGDKKEDTLLRILALAENEAVRGTHPALEGSLKAVDATIATLIKQINGIVAGQDSQILELKEKLDKSIEEKITTLETAKAQTEAAQARSDAADAAIKQAQEDAAIAIEKANSERDQAIRERDDARTISAEKTASNDLLMRQMTAMEADVKARKNLQSKYEQLSADYLSLQAQIKAMEADFTRRMEMAKAGEELAIEKAIHAKEKEIRSEYEEKIRKADLEMARLQVKLEASLDNQKKK